MPTPVGKRDGRELSRIRALSSAEAQRKMTRARYSNTSMVAASITLTPAARSRRSSYRTLWTTLLGRRVSRPVAVAAGRVEAMLLK